MKVGDLVKFTGSWGPRVVGDPRKLVPSTGVVTEVWTNGRTRLAQRVDVLWDDSTVRQASINSLKVVNAGG